MREYTNQNHFKFGYNGYLQMQDRRSAKDQWQITYGRCSRPVTSFRDEVIKTAGLILQKHPKVGLCVSGGIDSEVMLRGFLQHKRNVQIYVMMFKHGLNKPDFDNAVRVCNSLGVGFDVIVFDLDDVKNKVIEIGVEVGSVSPQFALYCLLMQEVINDGYVPVIASGDNFIKNEYGQRMVWEKEKVASLYRYLIHRNAMGIPGFYQYTPELMYSIFADPTLISLVNHPDFTHYLNVKAKFYGSHFDLLFERPKLSGFELVNDWDSELRDYLTRTLPENSDSNFKTEMSRLAAYLEYGSSTALT